MDDRFEVSCDPPLENAPEDYKCAGCQRNELHMMCPAYGTPFYMSGVSYPEKLAKIVDILSPEDKQVIFDAIKGFAPIEDDKRIRGLQSNSVICDDLEAPRLLILLISWLIKLLQRIKILVSTLPTLYNKNRPLD